MEDIVSLCKRRGFVFQSSEIYGGFASCYDWGPLGVELKRNVKNEWWRSMVQERDDIVGIETSILMHPKVWEASGHVATFTDPLVDCKTCKGRFRADHLENTPCPQKPSKMAGTAEPCQLTDARQFNLMFKTHVGPVDKDDDSNIAYLRPETAQGMFVNFKNVLDSTNRKLPFGIAQMGKSFRNEITPKNFVFRVRELEQMEIEYFVKPEEGDSAFEAWLSDMRGWLRMIGVGEDHVRIREHDRDELSHYSSRTVDFEYEFPGSMGWRELYGLANRTDFDLGQHQQFSGEDLTYFDQAEDRRYLPHVIEPTFGVDRTCLVLLIDAYDEEQTVDVNGKPDTRVVLRLHPRVAPYKAAILPLMKKPELAEVARRLFDRLGEEIEVLVDYDESGNIGRRYRRQDEVGTPFCFTVDFDSLEDHSVTVRHRDDMRQERLQIADVPEWLAEQLR
jgi:glycyl-tRNA synthetase